MDSKPSKLRDNPRSWTHDYTPAPAEFPRATFQQKIDALVGIARGGQSIIRLVWGAEEEKLRFDIENPHDTTLKIPRYTTRIRGKEFKVRINRWILEEFVPPEQLEGMGEQYVRTNHGLFIPHQVKLDQQNGYYQCLYVIADHTKCEESVCNSDEYFCFGDYRVPDHTDLDKLRHIQYLKAQSEASMQFNPYAPLPQHALDFWLKQQLGESQGDS